VALVWLTKPMVARVALDWFPLMVARVAFGSLAPMVARVALESLPTMATRVALERFSPKDAFVRFSPNAVVRFSPKAVVALDAFVVANQALYSSFYAFSS
jgi:hypothetical protein